MFVALSISHFSNVGGGYPCNMFGGGGGGARTNYVLSRHDCGYRESLSAEHSRGRIKKKKEKKDGNRSECLGGG